MTSQPECKLIVGRRGSGKSTYAKRLVNDPDRRAVVVFDPMGEYHLPQLRNLLDVKQWLRNRWRSGFKVSFVPDPDADMLAECHRLAELLWQGQAPYGNGLKRRLTFIVDEANIAFPVTGLKAGQRAMQKLTLQGRHRGIEMALITQRPSLVSKDYRGNCSEFVIFPLTNKDDQKAITTFIGDGHANELANQKDHNYLLWRPEGVQKGHNPAI